MAYIKQTIFLVLTLSSIAIGERVSFESLKHLLLEKNLNIKISKTEIEIAKERYKVERSYLFPTVSIDFYNEYLKDLRNSPTYINGQYYIGSTGYSSSISLRFDYLIFDFGSRKYRLKMYETSISTSKENLSYMKEKQILTLLDKYYEALINQERLTSLNKLRLLYIKLYKVNQRLYKAGIISKENIIDIAIRLAEISAQIEDLKQRQDSIINEISFLVDKKLKNPYFENFEEVNIEENINIEELPEIVAYDKKIKEKEYQLKSERLNFFPKVQLFGRYSMSNFNRNDYVKTINGLQPVNWGIGFVVNLTLFNGFKTTHTVMQIKKEIEKLKLEKRLVIKQKETEIKTNYTDIKHNKLKIKQIKEKVRNIAEDLKNKERLYKVGKESKINIIQKQIDIVNESLNLKLSEIKNLYIAKKLKILKEFSLEHRFSSN